MGLILDSSVLIKAERQGQNARKMLRAISRTAGETEIALSLVTLLEVAHGAARADTAERKQTRQQFIQELLAALPIHPVTVPVALRVGQIDGENQTKGVRLPLADLLIGSLPWNSATVWQRAICATSSASPACRSCS